MTDYLTAALERLRGVLDGLGSWDAGGAPVVSLTVEQARALLDALGPSFVRVPVLPVDEEAERAFERAHPTSQERGKPLPRPASGWVSPSALAEAIRDERAACLGIARRWEAAYPTDVFPEGSDSLDAKAAKHGRTVAQGIAREIEERGSGGAGGTPSAPPLSSTATSSPRTSSPCPSEKCAACTGEACWLCGAGCWDTSVRNCEHDVTQRHERPKGGRS